MRRHLLLLPAGAALASSQTAEVPEQASVVFTREAMVAEINPANCLPESWLGRQDSNLRMPVPKTGALPLGYAPAGARRI